MKDESSTLWLATLGASHDEETERLRRSYIATRDHAATLLNELSHSTPHFTVHDITHVDALWETASMLCGSTVTLTCAEAYVLGCAFILHDAAMGAASYHESIPSVLGTAKWHDLLSSFIVAETGKWPTIEELDSPGKDIMMACTVHAIRELHAAHAEKLVDQSWKTSSGNELYLIEDLQLREWYGPLIGQLAASHWWPVDQLGTHFRHEKNSPPWLPAGWTVDPLKLACLLRLADATQIDSRRAPTFLFALRRPDGNSREHWRFQEHVARPRLRGDRVTYNSARAFEEGDADAWWLALDYLRGVDNELKKVDALLYDLDRPRFEGRAVAGVDSPRRFSEYFPVRGWSPVDARIAVSDVPHLVAALGGEQLYGKEPEVALRELLQNAQDATMARKSLDQDFTSDEIVVTLSETNDMWTLEVMDRGVGMDEEIVTTALLDFGRTGWTSDTARNKFAGLVDGGFRPKGRFGIGFFSVFILGDEIEVVTRRFDAGPADARKLRFRGVHARPTLTPIPASDRTPIGTRVTIRLKIRPYEVDGILRNTSDDRLDELIQRVCPEHPVPIRAVDTNRHMSVTLPPVDLRLASSAEIFDILYPPVQSGKTFAEMQRQHVRSAFIDRATEMVNEDGARIGVAAFGMYWYFASSARVRGAVLLNGFRSDDHTNFAGYLIGKPGRASRDRAEIIGTQDEVRSWVNSQEERLRELGLLRDRTKVDITNILYQANHELRSDYPVAFISNGLLTVADVENWAAGRKQIYLSLGWPLNLASSRVELVHMTTGCEVYLPDNWAYIIPSYVVAPFDVFEDWPDEEYEYARKSQEETWQKVWWRVSDTIRGLILRQICAAWNCTIGDILGPVEERGWDDVESIGDDNPIQLPVWRLDRPNHQR